MGTRRIFTRLVLASAYLCFSAAPALAWQDDGLPPVPTAEEQTHARAEMSQAGVATTDPVQLNLSAYRVLYEDHDIQRAISYFRWNLILNPRLAVEFYDSLGEAYIQAGNRDEAILAYSRAVASWTRPGVNQDRAALEHSRQLLARLRDSSTDLAALQAELRTQFQAAINAH